MKRVLAIVDLVIRIGSVIVLAILALPALLLVCVMGADTRMVNAVAFSACVFVVGTLVFLALGGLWLKPECVERLIPGPPLLGKAIARIPAYVIAAVGMFVLLRQVWRVAVPAVFE